MAKASVAILSLLSSQEPLIDTENFQPPVFRQEQLVAIDRNDIYEEDQMTKSRVLKPCNVDSNCVSSNYREPPNRYISPLKIVNTPDVAFQRAIRDLKRYQGNDISVLEIIPKEYYIHLAVPGTAPASFDDIELSFTNNDVLNLKCEARVTLPPPPFCLRKNCINGNMDQRYRLENVANVLGLPPSDSALMKGAKWTPIFFNSDRVPGFEDDF